MTQEIKVISAEQLQFSELDLLQAWIVKNRLELERGLLKDGALLLRGFTIRTGKEFESVVRAFDTDNTLLEYVGGTSPREKVTEKIFTSTSTPSFMKIPLHSELSYQAESPKKIFFYCKIAPQVRGETPIADTRKVYASIPVQIRERFDILGICYVRKLKNRNSSKNFLMRLFSRLSRFADQQTWQGAFGTEDRVKVEAHCKEKYTSHEWQKDGSLVIKNNLPAFRVHPETLEKVWYNQMHFSHRHPSVFGLIPTLMARTLSLFGLSNQDESTFGDGSKITDDQLVAVMNSFKRHQISFPWEAGDVLVLDNLLMAHGRNSFRGPREILVGMLG